jgi:hypothetical protein
MKVLTLTTFAAVAAVSFTTGKAAAPPPAMELAAPVQVLDGDKPIDVTTGHAAPAVFDINGDGRKDLIVGQFDGGKARIYRNKGTNGAPSFEGYTFLIAGGETASVPHG